MEQRFVPGDSVNDYYFDTIVRRSDSPKSESAGAIGG
jgi:hypothetical protein